MQLMFDIYRLSIKKGLSIIDINLDIRCTALLTMVSNYMSSKDLYTKVLALVNLEKSGEPIGTISLLYRLAAVILKWNAFIFFKK